MSHWEESRRRIIDMFQLQADRVRDYIAKREQQAYEQDVQIDLTPYRKLLAEIEQRIIRIKTQPRRVMIQ